ncbi:TRL-like family protein [Membranihabitans maritimus]|uniref:TRL-like family protein n=1 Tax=Membranihabitans maritimus TaxID=2904244 RepID=UPI001F16D05C|nr:TRL-like family protein [Membranihabitans maritimus]
MLTKIKAIFALLAVLVCMTSCATVKSPLSGMVYSDVKAPVAVTGNSNSTKVGSSEATSILGIVATGDASIEAAAKSAGITKIHHVDEQSSSILVFFAKYKVFVYGE